MRGVSRQGLLRRACGRFRRRDRGVGCAGRGSNGAVGLSLTASRVLLLLRLGGLVGKLYLTLTEFLHHVAPRRLILGIVHRRPVEGLAESSEWNRESHRLLLHVHGSDDHLLALPHLLEHLLAELHLDLTARREAD